MRSAYKWKNNQDQAKPYEQNSQQFERSLAYE